MQRHLREGRLYGRRAGTTVAPALASEFAVMGGHLGVIYSTRLLSLTGSGSEQGQGLAEYALILALIAIVAILALTFLGTQISSLLSYIGVAI